MTPSPDAILGAVVTCTLVLGSALWKLATMLAEVRGQVRHNGGSTMKDYAQQAKNDARLAREVAEETRAVAVNTADLLNRRLDKSEDRAVAVELRTARQLDSLEVRVEHLGALTASNAAALAKAAEKTAVRTDAAIVHEHAAPPHANPPAA